MRILRVNADHYVTSSPDELAHYALVLLGKRLATGEVPDRMDKLARASCDDRDGATAFALLQQLDDVELIPAKVL